MDFNDSALHALIGIADKRKGSVLECVLETDSHWQGEILWMNDKPQSFGVCTAKN